MIVCSNCGAQNRDGAKMCSQCGKPLPQAPAPPPVPPSYQPAPGGYGQPVTPVTPAPVAGPTPIKQGRWKRLALGCLLLFVGFLCGLATTLLLQLIVPYFNITVR